MAQESGEVYRRTLSDLLELNRRQAQVLESGLRQLNSRSSSGSVGVLEVRQTSSRSGTARRTSSTGPTRSGSAYPYYPSSASASRSAAYSNPYRSSVPSRSSSSYRTSSSRYPTSRASTSYGSTYGSATRRSPAEIEELRTQLAAIRRRLTEQDRRLADYDRRIRANERAISDITGIGNGTSPGAGGGGTWSDTGNISGTYDGSQISPPRRGEGVWR